MNGYRVISMGLLALLALEITHLPVRAENPPVSASASSEEAEKIYRKAFQLMNENKMDEALAALDSLPASEAGKVPALNLRGALLVRKKDLAGAEKAFSKILELDPKSTVAKFNLGEVYFLRKDYAKARPWFQQFLAEPGNSQNALARYKIYLCELLGADPTAARKTLDSLEPTISHPFYYFAHAAMAFHEGRPEEAREYVQSAFSIYAGGLNAAFADSMIELGWLNKTEVAQVGAIDEASLRSLSSEFRPGPAQPPARSGPASFEQVLPDFMREEEKKPDAKPDSQP